MLGLVTRAMLSCAWTTRESSELGYNLQLPGRRRHWSVTGICGSWAKRSVCLIKHWNFDWCICSFANVVTFKVTEICYHGKCNVSVLTKRAICKLHRYYTCAWSYEPETMHPYLAFAGRQGIIRIVKPTTFEQIKTYIGHGQAINELRLNPIDSRMLLSASADHTIRLWNIHTGVCICILGGEHGHRDEVLSADFNADATKLISCGMDHSLKIWSLEADDVKTIIEASHKHDPAKNSKKYTSFKPITVHVPVFSTYAVHQNYVDCTRWLGELVLSKVKPIALTRIAIAVSCLGKCGPRLPLSIHPLLKVVFVLVICHKCDDGECAIIYHGQTRIYALICMRGCDGGGVLACARACVCVRLLRMQVNWALEKRSMVLNEGNKVYMCATCWHCAPWNAHFWKRAEDETDAACFSLQNMGPIPVV